MPMAAVTGATYDEQMNSKYLGNSLDLMKYDLLTHLIKCSEGCGLMYIPMLTEPQPKERNPKYETYEIGTLNKPLLKLMQKEYKKDFSDIKMVKKYFVDSGIHLSMLSPVGMKFFCEENRKDYFIEAINHYKSLVNETLVYVDPDVGCDIGISRRFRSNKHKYIKKHEVMSLQQSLRKGGSLCYFQHLGDSNYSMSDRMKDLTDAFGEFILFVAYTRIQAGFVFIFNDESTCLDKRVIIEQYYHQYAHLKHCDKFIINGKPLKSSGFLAS
jgi:hypothetical protein